MLFHQVQQEEGWMGGHVIMYYRVCGSHFKMQPRQEKCSLNLSFY